MESHGAGLIANSEHFEEFVPESLAKAQVRYPVHPMSGVSASLPEASESWIF
jgi:hypothetical protein